MEASAFDRLARAVATSGTRRRLLALVSALPLAGLFAADDELDAGAKGRRGHRHQARHHHRHARTQRRKDHRDDAHGEACIPTGQRCPSKKPRGKHGKKLNCEQCCQRFVVTDPNGKRVCGCKPGGETCGPDTASQCCSGICAGATCQSAAPSPPPPSPPSPPPPPPPPCVVDCPGCCDGSGTCLSGDDDDACGQFGAGCVICPPASPLCLSHVCSPCTNDGACQAAGLGPRCCGDGACGQCCATGDCSGTTPLCVAHTCSACSGDGSCQSAGLSAHCCGDGSCHACCSNTDCSGTTPICDNGTCVACTSNTQCPTDSLCMTDGSCQACDVTCASPTCTGNPVQTFIDAHPAQTVFLICPGIYIGNLDLNRNLSLIGAGDGGGTGDTILFGDAADQPNSVVTIEPSTTVSLRDLQIRGGFDDLGGGVCHQGDSLTMTNCTITSNTADADGGGLCTEFGTESFLTGCTISGNHALDDGSAIGGGINNRGTMTLIDCTVEGNTADADGAGIYNSATMSLTDCTVQNNTADNNGGGFFNSTSSDPSFILTLVGTTVTDNHANGVMSAGGGIFNDSGSKVDLQSGTSVSGNFATSQPNCGGDLSGYTDPGGACEP